MARKPANNPGLRKMGIVRGGNSAQDGSGQPEPSRDGEIVTLLAQIGDRLQKNEREREAFKESLKDYSRVIDGLENRSEQSESIFLTLQDKLSKQESAEMSLRRRQERLEAAHEEQADRIEKAAALADRIEETLAMQERLSRRLDKLIQDKARFIRKLERIEETVIETRAAIESGALALPGRESVLALTGPLPANDDLSEAGKSERGTWGKTALILMVLLVLGVLVGLGMAGLGLTLPQDEIAQQQEPSATPAPPTFEQTPPRTLPETWSDAAPESAVSEDGAASASPAPLNPLAMNDRQMAEAFDKDPKALAEALNAIEPSTLPPPMAVQDKSEPPPLPVSVAKEKEDVSAPAPAAPPATKRETPAAPLPKKTESVPAKPVSVEKADIKNGFDSDSFLKSQTPGGSLPSRLQPDPSLPGGAAEIQRQAFNGVPEAQHDLAALYTAGRAGIPIDYARAAQWFREAAVRGIPNAQYNLGVLYHKGLGVKQDTAQALSWYRTAAASNHPEAEYNLGIAHIEGMGAAYDPKLAMQYFRKSAIQGVMEASYNLGLIYENGLLGAPQTDQALYWYRTAAGQGSPEGRAAMNQLARSLKYGPKDLDRIYDAVRARERSTGNTLPAADVPLEDLSSLGQAEETPAAEPPVAATETPAPEQATTAQIQEQLVRRGLYPGPADGLNGQATEDAIRAYQRENGLPQDGQPSQALLVNMLNSTATSESGTLRTSDLAQPGM